jgi:hypothetical protein
MPTIPVYLKDRVYWKLTLEAEKSGMTLGKFISTLCENYVKFLEEKEVREWQRENTGSSTSHT